MQEIVIDYCMLKIKIKIEICEHDVKTNILNLYKPGTFYYQ